MNELAPLLLVFPVAGLLLNLLFGKRMDERWIGIVEADGQDDCIYG